MCAFTSGNQFLYTHSHVNYVWVGRSHSIYARPRVQVNAYHLKHITISFFVGVMLAYMIFIGLLVCACLDIGTQ